MTKKSNSEKFISKLESWSDQECLEHLSLMIGRVGLTTEFVTQEDGMITHQMIIAVCGDKMIVSEPKELLWPLQMMPMPEALKGKVN